MWNRVEFGEIVSTKRGRPQFNDLLFHRGEPCFFAFDLLMSDGRDLRTEGLTDRKHELRRLLSKVSVFRMRYVEHVEQQGTALFERVCKMDLEGVVAKHSFGNYVTERERTTWFKIKNRSYPRCRAVRNCSSANATKNLSLAGTVVNWLARRLMHGEHTRQNKDQR